MRRVLRPRMRNASNRRRGPCRSYGTGWFPPSPSFPLDCCPRKPLSLAAPDLLVKKSVPTLLHFFHLLLQGRSPSLRTPFWPSVPLWRALPPTPCVRSWENPPPWSRTISMRVAPPCILSGIPPPEISSTAPSPPLPSPPPISPLPPPLCSPSPLLPSSPLPLPLPSLPSPLPPLLSSPHQIYLALCSQKLQGFEPNESRDSMRTLSVRALLL